MTPSSNTTALSAPFSNPSDYKPGVSGFIQNLSTNPLYVKRGTGASSSDFDFVLNPAPAAGQAGGEATWDNYQGTVTVAGTAISYVASWT